MSDYGMRSKKRAKLPVVLGGVVAVVVIGWFVGDWAYARSTQRASEQKNRAFWTVAGAPCPTSSRAEIEASRIRLRKGFVFAGVAMEHGYGDVSCHEFHSGVRKAVGGELICQFTNPSALRIQTESAEAYFKTDAAPATIAIKGGEPSCVMAANFKPGINDPED